MDIQSALLLPIEPLPLRYSAQWLDWFDDAFEQAHRSDVLSSYLMSNPTEGMSGSVGDGEFLAPAETHRYKGRQVQEIAELVPGMEEPILLFFLDLWHPGVISAAYIRDALDLDLRISGILHAGTYDPWDFLAHKSMGRWARGFEKSVLEATDEVCVGSTYHANLLNSTFGSENITVTGLPVYTDEERRVWSPAVEKNRVVFPHRMAVEKGHDVFEAIVDLYEDRFPEDEVEWIRTADVMDKAGKIPATEKKEEYYDILAGSDVAVSCARQETFGIAMQEARNLGCVPVVPDRLAYTNTVPSHCRYETLGEAVRMIRRGLEMSHAGGDYTELRSNNIVQWAVGNAPEPPESPQPAFWTEPSVIR